MSVAALPWLIVAAALLVLAAVVIRRQRSSRVALLFAAMITLVAVWFLGFGLMFLAQSAPRAELWARIAIAAVAMLPAALYDFTATALRHYTDRRLVIGVLWIISALFSLLVLSSDVIVDGVRQYSWGFYPRASTLGWLYLVYFAGVLIAHIVEYVNAYRASEDAGRRARVRRLAISFAIVYLAAIDYIPMFGFDQRPVAYLPVIAFIAYAWQSIRRHRLGTITAASAAREILETMADALFVVDAEGKIRVVNGAVRTTFGYSDTEILGRSIDALEVIDGDHTITRTMGHLVQRGAIRDQERAFRHRNGDRIEVSVSISPVAGEEEQGAVVIARDIRERKRAEAELHEFTRKLQESNRELEDFAYVASHDLQEPLRKIQAFGDRLRTKHRETLDAEAVDYLDRIVGAARRMQTLINDLLTFSRVTTKGQPLVRVDLNSVMREVLHDLEVTIHDAGATVTVGELPEVRADALQMRQLFQNLVTNAIKFRRPDVPPQISIEGRAGSWSADISVRDNGIGFDQKYADRIFTMFERLHGRSTYEGTGIGLAICRKIARRHDGDVIARSEPGAGATFVVTLPLTHEKDSPHA